MSNGRRYHSNKDKYLGVEFETNRSGKCFVVDYNGNRDVTVMFHDPPYLTNCQLIHLKAGNVINPMKRTVFNVGYLGVGSFTSFAHSQAYSTWFKMLTRCYNEAVRFKHPSYKDVTVCEEWHNFQNFAEWCYKQKYFKAVDDRGKIYALDKDILVKGNKVYSPETCCFVPQEINSFLISRKSTRGKYPIGVQLDERAKRFRASISGGSGKTIHLGRFDTADHAFQAYKEAKEALFKKLAEKWDGRVDNEVYQALINYNVSIGD